jgi:hypothetical protein
MPTSHINTLTACQFLAAKCLINANGTVEKFLEGANENKIATFLYNNSLKRFYVKCKMATE